MNLSEQELYGIRLRLIVRKDYGKRNAKRFLLVGTKQNIWIPNFCLKDDGTIVTSGNPIQQHMLHYISLELLRKAYIAGLIEN